MTERQYDESVADLVAYLQWMGEPAQGQRFQLGVIVLIFLGFLFNDAFQPAIIAIVIVYALILVGFAVWGRKQLVLSPEEEYALSGGLHGDPEKDGYGGAVAEEIRTDDLDPTGRPKA
jgi:ethanolamine permease